MRTRWIFWVLIAAGHGGCHPRVVVGYERAGSADVGPTDAGANRDARAASEGDDVEMMQEGENVDDSSDDDSDDVQMGDDESDSEGDD